MVEVMIANDPFTTFVEYTRLTKSTTRRSKTDMPTTAKDLRKRAKELSIDGWEEMDRDELAEAISSHDGDKPAKASKTAKPAAKKGAAKTKEASKKAAGSKKAATGKKTSKAASTSDGPNPFREGSNLWMMTEELLKGGKRSAMVTRLRKKIELNPRQRAGKDFDVDAEIDYRLVRVCQTLTNEYGFTIEKDGRGVDSTVQAIPG